MQRVGELVSRQIDVFVSRIRSFRLAQTSDEARSKAEMFELLTRFHTLLRLLREVSNRGDPTIRVIDGFRRCERGIEMSGAYSSIPADL